MKKAQSIIEYALIFALVSVIAIGVLQLMGGSIKKSAQSATNTVETGAANASEQYCKNTQGTWDSSTSTCKY